VRADRGSRETSTDPTPPPRRVSACPAPRKTTATTSTIPDNGSRRRRGHTGTAALTGHRTPRRVAGFYLISRPVQGIGLRKGARSW
jgi:hypothetical protein